MARIPVDGVRTTCANAASAASTILGTGIVAARLPRALAAATAGTRFFSRPLGGRLGRFKRGFAAMNPHRGRCQHATGGPRESRARNFQLWIVLGMVSLDSFWEVLPQLRQTHAARMAGWGAPAAPR